VSESSVPKLVPQPDGLNAEFYAYCAAGELRFQRCTACATWRHPPRVRCAACGSDEYEWALATGRGQVYSWTITHRPLDPGFADEVPYAVLVVEMEEGPRVVGNLRELEPSELSLGLAVEVVFEPVADQIALTHFRPASSR
jgi:uncharacterized OB-fold protein